MSLTCVFDNMSENTPNVQTAYFTFDLVPFNYMGAVKFQTRHFTTWTLAPWLCSNNKKKKKIRTYLPKKRHRSPGIWDMRNMGVTGEIKHNRHVQYPTHQQKQKRWDKHLFERAGETAEERQNIQKAVVIIWETRGRCCIFAVYVHQNKPPQAPA